MDMGHAMENGAEECDNGGLIDAFKSETSKTALSPEEVEAEAFDDGEVAVYGYTKDEREGVVFKELRYCKEREALVARFIAAPGASSSLPYVDATYAQVLRLARFFHEAGIKPSQSNKAVAAFSARLQHEVAKLDLP